MIFAGCPLGLCTVFVLYVLYTILKDITINIRPLPTLPYAREQLVHLFPASDQRIAPVCKNNFPALISTAPNTH